MIIKAGLMLSYINLEKVDSDTSLEKRGLLPNWKDWAFDVGQAVEDIVAVVILSKQTADGDGFALFKKVPVSSFLRAFISALPLSQNTQVQDKNTNTVAGVQPCPSRHVRAQAHVDA